MVLFLKRYFVENCHAKLKKKFFLFIFYDKKKFLLFLIKKKFNLLPTLSLKKIGVIEIIFQ